MCGSVSWYAIVACVILFLSILASVQCLPLDNSPSILHRKSPLIDGADDATDFRNYRHVMDTHTSRASTTHHNFYWWQVERASGVQEVDTLDREKRFPRIVSIYPSTSKTIQYLLQ